MENKHDKKIKNIMAKVFKVKLEDIHNNSSPNSIKEWDSLKHFNLIVALEEEFKIKLDEHEVESMVSFSIISSTIHAYLE